VIRPVSLLCLIALTTACNRDAPANNAAAPPAAQPNGAQASPPAVNTQTAQPGASPTAWQTTPSGLRYRRIGGSGTGPKPSISSTVTFHYVGSLPDGTVFDSSVERGEPVTMPLAAVIPGWQEGVPLMSVGDVYEFEIPPALGYGPEGAGPIPPNTTLNFRVGLLRIDS
jgi:FKBP-type peptidyl-prolyl cis-trans isomerase FkpA